MADGKLVYDTSVYIELIRSKQFAESFRSVYESNITVTFFSSVVVQELLAGATDQLKVAAVEGFYRPFERSRRLVTPTHAVWYQAGRVLGTMRKKRTDLQGSLAGTFVNDLLIALSAKGVGARIVTFNSDDFELIRKFTSVNLEVLGS